MLLINNVFFFFAHGCLFFSFLTQCRPLSVSMGNAIKYLKLQITHTPPDMVEEKVSLCNL